MPKTERNSAWITADELKFVTTLGTHSEVGKKAGHKALLDGYAAGIAHRAKWDGLDYMRISNEVAMRQVAT